MANALYDYGREGFLAGDISWRDDNIKVALIDTGVYTVNLATHQFYSDLSGVVANSSNLSSKTVTDGIANAADAQFTTVTGATSEALVIYQDTGVTTTSRLIAYIDDVASGLPITPNGGNIVVTWDTGLDKIFKL